MAFLCSGIDLCNTTINCTWCARNNSSENIKESHISAEMRTGISAYYCFIIAASVTCNTALIAIIAKCKRLHTMSHLFIVNLAVSNLLSSLLYLPFDVEKNLRGGFFSHGKFLCGVYQLFFMLSLPLSTINLLLLTTETFITIVFPYKRAHLVNRRSVTIIVILAYFYAVTYTFFPVLHHPQHSIVVHEGLCYANFSLAYIYYFVVINLFIPLAVIIVLNLIIFNIANNHKKQIRSVCTASGIVSTPHCTPTTLQTVVESTAMMQPSGLFPPVNNAIVDGNEGRGISCNTDTLLDVLPFGNGNSQWSGENNINNAVMNGSRPTHGSLLPDTLSTFLQSKCYSLTSLSSCMTFDVHSPMEEDGMTLSMIPIKKQRQNSQVSTFLCNIKAAKRIGLLVGECIFCWLFYIIIVLINISGKWKDPTWNPILTEIGMMINCSSLMLNPLVYGSMNPKIRAVIIDTLSCLWHSAR